MLFDTNVRLRKQVLRAETNCNFPCSAACHDSLNVPAEGDAVEGESGDLFYFKRGNDALFPFSHPTVSCVLSLFLRHHFYPAPRYFAVLFVDTLHPPLFRVSDFGVFFPPPLFVTVNYC